MRTKLEKSNQKINSFGGINFLLSDIKQSGILQIIDNQLDDRAKQSKYSCSDVLLNLYSIFFCGGQCAEDITEHLRSDLLSIPNNKVPSPDTILRILKKLKTEKEEYISPSGKSYNINKNTKLNQLNLSILKKRRSFKRDSNI